VGGDELESAQYFTMVLSMAVIRKSTSLDLIWLGAGPGFDSKEQGWQVKQSFV